MSGSSHRLSEYPTLVGSGYEYLSHSHWYTAVKRRCTNDRPAAVSIQANYYFRSETFKVESQPSGEVSDEKKLPSFIKNLTTLFGDRLDRD